jgi:hypothetical protein
LEIKKSVAVGMTFKLRYKDEMQLALLLKEWRGEHQAGSWCAKSLKKELLAYLKSQRECYESGAIFF